MNDNSAARPHAELLRLVAGRLYRDHAHRPDGTDCVMCGQPWPCSGRRLAELGLIRAAGGVAG